MFQATNDMGPTVPGPGPRLPLPAGNQSDSEDPALALDKFMNAVVYYLCAQRSLQVSSWRIAQNLLDLLYEQGWNTSHSYLTGSLYEGIVWGMCGDMDVMHTKRSHPLVFLPNSASEVTYRIGHVIAQCNPDQPAYLRLLAPEGVAFKSDDVADSVTEYNGTRYLSSSMLVGHVVGDDAEVHGPAGTKVAWEQKPDWGMVDDVQCLHSPSWPPCAQEFFIRPRSHGWPNQGLLQNIKQNGCHVVGVGHQSTERRDLEWRWSFSLAEKELIHHLDTEMACSMYVLKALKKRKWREETDGPQAICSYHLKVACLWVAEERGSTYDIMTTLRNVLDWLIQGYLCNNIPHYFISKQNLIGHLPMALCQMMASALGDVKSQVGREILCSVEMDSNLKNIINSIQEKLGMAPLELSTIDDATQFVVSILGYDREKTVQTLGEATHSLAPGSEMYTLKEQSHERYWLATDYAEVYEALEEHISTKPISEIVLVTEGIILRLIDRLPSITHPRYVDSFRCTLYRHLGNLFHGLHAYCKNKTTDLPPGILIECYQKSEKYYAGGNRIPPGEWFGLTDDIDMVYPDGWSDGGLSGFVHLAKFYHLNGEWNKVEGVMVQLTPLLEEARHLPKILNRLSGIVIDTQYELCKIRWQSDRLFYQLLVENIADVTARINPIMLGYYIQGRLALWRGRKDLAEDCARYMGLVGELILDKPQKQSSQDLPDVLNAYLAIPMCDENYLLKADLDQE